MPHGCHLFKWPADNCEFWRAKIGRNRERDARTLVALNDVGWRVMTVWECALRGRGRHPIDQAVSAIEVWVREATGNGELSGRLPE